MFNKAAFNRSLYNRITGIEHFVSIDFLGTASDKLKPLKIISSALTGEALATLTITTLKQIGANIKVNSESELIALPIMHFKAESYFEGDSEIKITAISSVDNDVDFLGGSEVQTAFKVLIVGESNFRTGTVAEFVPLLIKGVEVDFASGGELSADLLAIVELDALVTCGANAVFTSVVVKESGLTYDGSSEFAGGVDKMLFVSAALESESDLKVNATKYVAARLTSINGGSAFFAEFEEERVNPLLEQANQYYFGTLSGDIWSSFSEEDKLKALLEASRLIKSLPLRNAPNKIIQQAVFEQALCLLSMTDATKRRRMLQLDGVTSISAGHASESYSDKRSKLGAFLLCPKVEALLDPYANAGAVLCGQIRTCRR